VKEENMNILIVNASSTVRTKIEELLTNMDFDDLDINSFEDASDALDYSRDNDVDLIFSAIETEGIDGLDFVEALLNDNPKHVSRLFIVTSQKNTENMTDIKDIGAKRFIPKPINEEYFNHFIKQEIDKILNNK